MSEVSFGKRGTGPDDRARAPALDPVANDFQSDAAAIEEAPVPLSAHAALYVVLALLVIAVAWAILGAVDRIVVGAGKIATRTPMLVMQPFTTSRILAVHVKAGDHVRKGQVLVTFDPSFAQADVTALRQKVASLTAQGERLDAELSGRPFLVTADDTPERLTQKQIYDHQISDQQAEIDQRASRIAQYESQIRTDEAQIPGIQAQLGMAQRVVDMYNRLERQKAAATLDILRAQSSLIDSQNRLKNVAGDRDKAIQQRAETVQERQALVDKWRSDRSQELVQTRQDLSEASETLNKANRMHEFTNMTAPVDGVVQEVADRSTGSVLKEAETVVTLVPDGADLYVDAKVPSRDIGYIKVGDTVRVKLESYPFQRFGTISGVLAVISPDSMPLKEGDERSELVYPVQVRLNASTGELARRGIHIKPGLGASAEIKTGRRSIAAYLLDPVLRISDESMREP